MRHPSSRSPSRPRSARPALEALEGRVVPTISLSASGVLSVTGGAGNDAFVLELESGGPTNIQASDDGGATFQTFALTQVHSVTVNGFGGQNTLTVNNDNGLVAKDDAFANSIGLPITFQGNKALGARDTLIVTGDPGKVTPGQGNPEFNEIYQGATTQSSLFGAPAAPNYLHIGDTFSSPGGMGAAKAVTIFLPDVAAVEDFGPVATRISPGNAALGKGAVLQILDGPTLNGLATTQVRGAFRTDLDLAPDASPGGDGSDDAFEGAPAIDFANKASVTVAGDRGYDLFLVNNPHPAAGLTQLTLTDTLGPSALTVKNTPPPGVNVTPVPTSTYFIQELYALRLSRAATPSEVADWTGVLNGTGQAAVVSGIEFSYEAALNKADAWYVHYLGRQAQNGEEAGWAQQLASWAQAHASNAGEQQVLVQFLSSPEFFQHAQALGFTGTADAQFVQAVYGLALTRTPSASELAYWQGVFAGQGAGAVAAGVINSLEFRAVMVYRYYDVLLGRVPSGTEVSEFVGSGFGIGDVRDLIEAGSEFYFR